MLVRAYVPLSQVGAELLFEVFSQRYERGSIILTSNLPFEEWPALIRFERLTGDLIDRLKQSSGRQHATAASEEQNQAPHHLTEATEAAARSLRRD